MTREATPPRRSQAPRTRYFPPPARRFLLVHVTHNWASLDAMQVLAELPARELIDQARSLPGCDETALLRTCNRMEFYFTTDDPAALQSAVHKWLAPHIGTNLLRSAQDLEACRHLMRVASGLDSLLVGEEQILGQVRSALKDATDAGAARRRLQTLFGRALVAGKRARRETGIGRGSVSLGKAAVRLARDELDGLDGKKVVLIGTGEMATLVAKALAAEGTRETVVVSKSAARARRLAQETGGTAAAYEDLVEHLPAAHAVIAATGAPSRPGTDNPSSSRPRERILTRDSLAACLGPEAAPLLIIDISQPQVVDTEVSSIPGIRLLGLDGFREAALENLEKRRAEASRAERVVEEELASYAAKLSEERAEALVAAIHMRMQTIREEAVRRAEKRLGLEPGRHKVVSDMTNSMLKRFLATPTASLKRMAREKDAAGIEAVARAFGLEVDV